MVGNIQRFSKKYQFDCFDNGELRFQRFAHASLINEVYFPASAQPRETFLKSQIEKSPKTNRFWGSPRYISKKKQWYFNRPAAFSLVPKNIDLF